MSSTTRVGFNVPAVGDFADEIAYYDNNITTYENELPSQVVSSLPVSSNYAGQVRAINNAQVANPPSPAMPYDEYIYTGSAWIPYSAAGLRKNTSGPSVLSNSSGIQSSSSEVFSSVMPGFNQVASQAGSIIKFMCQFHLAETDVESIFTGTFNIFVNPSSSSQPTPTTPGAVRLSFPVVGSDTNYDTPPEAGTSRGSSNTPPCLSYVYGELLYAATYTGTIGVGCYLGVTNNYTSARASAHDPASDSWPITMPSHGSYVVTEIAGTWSG